MRLIDADTHKDSLKKEKRWIVKRDDYTNEGFSYDQVMFAIDDAPTIDAVEVVRCKDCKHWFSNVAGYTGDEIGHCEWAGWMVGKNGYCVYGERKEEVQDE